MIHVYNLQAKNDMFMTEIKGDVNKYIDCVHGLKEST